MPGLEIPDRESEALDRVEASNDPIDKLAALNDYAQERCATFDLDFPGMECPDSALGLEITQQEYDESMARVRDLIAARRAAATG